MVIAFSALQGQRPKTRMVMGFFKTCKKTRLGRRRQKIGFVDYRQTRYFGGLSIIDKPLKEPHDTRTVMAFFKTCKKTGPGHALTFPSCKKRRLFCRSSDGALRIKSINGNTISDIPPTMYPALCRIKRGGERRRKRSAQKMGLRHVPCF